MMDWSTIAALPAVVDEEQVQAEVEAHLGGRPAPEREPWKITSIGAADWAMRQLGIAQRTAGEYADQVAMWTEAAARVRSAAAWFDARLKEWAIAERTEQRKSFPLAHGTVSTRKVGASITVVDEDAVIGWARTACPDAIRTVESIIVAPLKAAASIVEHVVAFNATDKATGETERHEVSPVPVDPEKIAGLREAMEYHVIEVETVLLAVDSTGKEIPGVEVTPGKISASVGAILL
jgi:phage host-nuclease inhibitor protein Gam